MSNVNDDIGQGRALVAKPGTSAVAPASVRPRARVFGVAAITGGLGVGVGAIGAVAAEWAGWSAVTAVLTLISNVAMAGAAIAALGLWQKQVRGTKDYETATKVLRTVLAAATAAKRSLRNPDDPGLLRDLEEANDAVSESIIDVRVVDATEAPAISEVWYLVRDWIASVREQADVSPRPRSWDWGELVGSNPDATKAFRTALDEKVADVRTWAEQYVGRR